ncbi:MAG TPA: DsrE family protein [Nitriliruptorales bacterium]
MLFMCTHGQDAPERATVPFIAANVAVASGQDAVVVCTIDAVWLGTPGVADRIHSEGQPALGELVTSFVAAGGGIWLCSACTTKRGITEDDCIQGATIVGAARLVEEIANGAQTITLA